MKKPRKTAASKNPVLDLELHHRLQELETELRSYLSNANGTRLLKEVGDLEDVQIAGNPAVQFSIDGAPWAAGHVDVTYSDSNHARGVRHIRLYQGEKIVLHIEGDFEAQQFGSNFRFQSVQIYLPGDWEKSFITLTDKLRSLREKRRVAHKKKRDAAR